MNDKGTMNDLATPCQIDLPHLGEAHDIASRVHTMLARAEVPETRHDDGDPLWGASRFGLQDSHLFRDLGNETQRELLTTCSNQLIEESFFIERAGMCFAPKMALLARSVEERMLYCLFSSQEASHYAMIAAHTAHEPDDPMDNPFLSLLVESISRGSRRQLVFLVQVVLEGWGLHHYRDLELSCQSPSLRSAFRQIRMDEAHHHGSGLSLFREDELTRRELSGLIEILVDFLALVQIGPTGVVSALEAAAGGLTLEQRARTFEEVGHRRETHRKLMLLRNLMEAGGGHAIVHELDRIGAFSCSSFRDCSLVMER